MISRLEIVVLNEVMRMRYVSRFLRLCKCVYVLSVPFVGYKFI